MPRLGAAHLDDRPRPTPRIVQFGEGNFLRAFFDWKVDRLNEAAGGDWGVVVVRPIDGGIPASLNEQDGVYTTLVRGMDESGDKVSEARRIACVRREISAYGEWDEVLGLARDPNIVLVVSNTTEAGIAYDPACRFDDLPPASFPAKVTRFLWERWSTLGRADAPGLQFLPCELIDHNADELRACVLQHAEEWKLDAGFVAWVETANAFYNTLVDRIVTGYPKAEIEELREKLGYDDSFIVAAELFHLLVIEHRNGTPAFVLPLEEHDTGTIVAPDAGPYKERKVGILNGAHTGLCPLAMLAGAETVSETVKDAAVTRFVDGMLEDEVLPFLSLPREELEAFAASVLRRFANPFIRHLWHDISLNGLAKFKTRNLPRLLAYLDKRGEPPKGMTLSLAAWLAFYLGRFQGAENLRPRDSEDVLALFERFGAIEDVDELVAAFLREPALWGEPLDDPKLHAAVAAGFRFLTEQPFTFARLDAFLEGFRKAA